MILVLATFDDPFYTFTTTLDGKQYIFEFRYNQRENTWYFSVELPDGTALVNGVKVVCGIPLLARVADVRLPPGYIMARANGTDASPPGMGELGEDKRVTLLYFTQDELA